MGHGLSGPPASKHLYSGTSNSRSGSNCSRILVIDNYNSSSR